jgi:predicted MPP superfamily phosphohydrolase
MIADKIKSTRPDIIVSTGDLVDGQINRIGGLAEILGRIKAPYGKFAIAGNHEYYAGFKQSTEFISKAGFTLLRGNAVYIPGIMNIAGVDDLAAIRYGLYRGITEKRVLSTLDPERFTLLLKHRPFIDNASVGMYDLQLSGHTHNGQIFPFNFLVQMHYPNLSGYFDVGRGSRLYVSRGTGTWGPPIRFLSPPEITVIDLVSKGGD